MADVASLGLTLNCIPYSREQKHVSVSDMSWPFQIAYEGDFWSLFTVTFWQKVDFLISNPCKNLQLYGSSQHWPALYLKPNVLDFRLLTVNLPKIVYNEVIDSWYNDFQKKTHSPTQDACQQKGFNMLTFLYFLPLFLSTTWVECVVLKHCGML